MQRRTAHTAQNIACARRKISFHSSNIGSKRYNASNPPSQKACKNMQVNLSPKKQCHAKNMHQGGKTTPTGNAMLMKLNDEAHYARDDASGNQALIALGLFAIISET